MSPEKPSASQIHDELVVELHDRQGANWTDGQKSQLSHELRTLASSCLFPLPDYNCLSSNYSTAFDDKLLAIARSSGSGEIVAFTSAVYLTDFKNKDVPFVVHTGLTCVVEDLRQKNLTILLFSHIFLHLVSEYPDGFWLSNLAGVISSLGSIGRYGTDVHPSPSSPGPSSIHRHIASTIDQHHRDKLLIDPKAVFDPEHFVFRGSNEPGSCFRKDNDDVRYADRHNAVNDFYRGLLRKDAGDEVLQVAFIDPSHIMASSNESRFDKLMGRETKL